MELDEVHALALELRQSIARVTVGQEETVRLLLAALLSEGHVLLEGLPGTGKTLLARTLAACLDLHFARIQFTPDLMPGDVIGTNLFHFETQRFVLTKGPVFTEFLLADEINRTPPKTQSALLEAMQERRVTIDGTSHELSAAFMVVATQNPIEHEGTYPLPEAQLDRFLFKVLVPYPARDEECEMVRIHGHRSVTPSLDAFDLRPLADRETVQRARQAVAGVRLTEELVGYVVDLVRSTRNHPSLQYGASPRSANMLACAARAMAALERRAFVIPDDVKGIFLPVMRHRVVLAPGAEIEGRSVDAVLEQVLEQVAAPR